jgi:DNA-binding transcriptional MerR regulator
VRSCPALGTRYSEQSVYTIKQASIRTGVGVPLLRAWERRYGIPTPERTASGYRLYDEGSIARVRRMRELVEAGWAPAQAARSILETPESAKAAESPKAAEPARPARGPARITAGKPQTAMAAGKPQTANAPADREHSLAAFREAAIRLDEVAMERVVGEAFAALGVDGALESFLLPAEASLGGAWARGEMDIAAEHAATNVVMRKLAALYDTAATPSRSGAVDCVIGLPPGGRHEVGALAFAVACRRAGLRVCYLGADVPLRSWLGVARDQPRATLVLGAVTPDEAKAAAVVAATVQAARPGAGVAIGGRSAYLAVTSGDTTLPGSVRESVAALRSLRDGTAR